MVWQDMPSLEVSLDIPTGPAPTPRPAAQAHFENELSEVVHQCGSGVTACHNLFAMEIAGLAGSQLYPGSWSEWSADPSRPVAQGA